MMEDDFNEKYEKVIKVLEELTDFCRAAMENYENNISKYEDAYKNIEEAQNSKINSAHDLEEEIKDAQDSIMFSLYNKIFSNDFLPKEDIKKFIEYSKIINKMFLEYEKKPDADELGQTARRLFNSSISLNNILKIWKESKIK